MTSLAKRLASVVDASALPLGGIGRVAVQSVVFVLAASMAFCAGLPSTHHPAAEPQLVAGARDVHAIAPGTPS